MTPPTDAPMQRVLVSGISGAGKSTLARAVSAVLDLPYTELDALHHGPRWVKRPEFEADAAALAVADRWVTEDQYQAFIGELLWERADTVLWLDLPRPTVMWRVITRTFGRMALRRRIYNGNRERFRNLLSSGHPIRWAWTHHAARSARTGELASRHRHARVVRFRSAGEVDAWLDELRAGVRPSSRPTT
jgi:adenylate kinase family enzyme